MSADEITVTGEPPRAIHPAGQFPAQCVDIIDLGENVETYQGKDPKVQHKCVVVWSTGEVNPDTGRPFEVRQEYVVSMYETANLRKMLESWRGTPYTEDEVNAGAPLHKLVGVWCMLTIANQKSAKGRMFAKVMSVTGLHKAIPRPDLPKYERDKFWAEKKKEYAEATAKHRSANTPKKAGVSEDFSDFPEALDDDDPESLPF